MSRRFCEAIKTGEGVILLKKPNRLAVLAMATAVVVLLAGCVTAPADGGAIQLRNKGIGKSFSRAMSQASGAISSTANSVGGAITGGFSEANRESGIVGRSAASSVSDAYRNASGQIVDAANNIIDMVPLKWPADLDGNAVTTTVNSMKGLFPAALAQLTSLGKQLKGLSSNEAEEAINDVLGLIGTPNPPVKIPIFTSTPVPVASHMHVRIRPSQWQKSYSANIQVKLDFLGIKSYIIGLGCIGFPDGFTEPPRMAVNGGCDNPWDLGKSEAIMKATAQSVTKKMENTIIGLTNQMTKAMTSLAVDPNNPRSIPPMLLDITINQILSEITPGFPSSSSASKAPDAKDTKTPEDKASNSAASDAVSSMAQSAAMEIAVPELGGISFAMAPDLSPVAYVDENWTKLGQIELGVELGMFGLFTAGVKMGCITFGETWKATPKFTFDGGCDKSWNVDFSATGYVSSSTRIDDRAANGGGSGTPLSGPIVPVFPSSAPAGALASGGTVTTITENGQKYVVHTFTIDDDSEFAIPASLSMIPLEYLIIGGGGAGSSVSAKNSIGVGGGGAGGILTNLGGTPLRLPTGTYTIVVGAGGTGPYSPDNALSGGNSTIGGSGLIALGGGGGGHLNSAGSAGGSGGGAGPLTGGGHSDADRKASGQANQEQGNNGGTGLQSGKGDTCNAGGGGGGWGSNGQPALEGCIGANGGDGRVSSISGTNQMYAAGGGGGARSGGYGGSGIGGNGANEKADGRAGTDNTGSGGGGGASGGDRQSAGGNGGSGIVIIRYPTS